MFTYDIRDLQRRLQSLGHYTGAIDGIIGPRTEGGIISFKRSVGLRATAYVGPITMRTLRSRTVSTPQLDMVEVIPPWINEINKVMGLHETRDKAELSEWLRSDGRTLGDPSALPWCGDASETAILNTLPKEPLLNTTRGNPYWARNWQKFGVPCGKVYGAAIPMIRGNGGHITFAVGITPDGKFVLGRGGNQSNMVKDSWFKVSRILNWRWPSTYPESFQRPLPVIDKATGQVVSINEI